MAPREANAFEYDWRYRARPQQLPPAGSWRVWLLMAGRGFGKTRCGAECVRAGGKGGRRRIALVGPTAADARNVMGEGAIPDSCHFARSGAPPLRAPQAPAYA